MLKVLEGFFVPLFWILPWTFCPLCLSASYPHLSISSKIYHHGTSGYGCARENPPHKDQRAPNWGSLGLSWVFCTSGVLGAPPSPPYTLFLPTSMGPPS